MKTIVLLMFLLLAALSEATKCSVQTSGGCGGCVSTTAFMFPCRWCSRDSQCHNPGAVGINPCAVDENIVTLAGCEELTSPVRKVYVIRRGLEIKNGTTDPRRLWAHSALLIRNSIRNYSIVEYLGDTKVYHYPIEIKAPNLKSFQAFDVTKTRVYNWDKQIRGTKIEETYTIEDVAKRMKEIMDGQPYDLLWHNCHVAQECTRLSYGWATLKELNYPETCVKLLKDKNIPCPTCIQFA